MPAPSSLAIKTSSVLRLIKEEASYHKEVAAQEAKVKKMEDANEEFYEVRKQKEVLGETTKMIPEVRKRLRDAVEVLDIELEKASDGEEKDKAKKAIEDGKAVYESEN